MVLYLQFYRHGEAQVCTHAFSKLKEIIQVLLLTGFLFTILMRVLKNDFLRYARSEDEEQGVSHFLCCVYGPLAPSAVLCLDGCLLTRDKTFAVTEAEESGWKLIHGDVFRCLCHVSSSSTMFPHQALIKNLGLFPFFHTPDIQTTRRFFVRFWATEHSSCVCALEYSSWHASACTGAFFISPPTTNPPYP